MSRRRHEMSPTRLATSPALGGPAACADEIGKLLPEALECGVRRPGLPTPRSGDDPIIALARAVLECGSRVAVLK